MDRILSWPVAVERCQQKPGKERKVHTSEIMSEINANNYEHPKDLQYKENPDDDTDDLLILSRLH